MAATAVAHRYHPAGCSAQIRHKHEYKPRDPAVTRCRCGNTKFEVEAGGVADLTVKCSRCYQINRTATCFELGRAYEAGHR